MQPSSYPKRGPASVCCPPCSQSIATRTIRLPPSLLRQPQSLMPLSPADPCALTSSTLFAGSSAAYSVQQLDVPMQAQAPPLAARERRSSPRMAKSSSPAFQPCLPSHQHAFLPLRTYRCCSCCVPLVTIIHIYTPQALPPYSSLLSHPPPFLLPFFLPSLYRTYRRLGTSGRPCRTSWGGRFEEPCVPW